MGRPSTHKFTNDKRIEVNPFIRHRPDNFWWALMRNPFRLPLEQNCVLVTLASFQGTAKSIQISVALLAKTCGFGYRTEKCGQRIKIISTPLNQAILELEGAGYIVVVKTRSGNGSKVTRYSVRPTMAMLGYLPSGRPDPSWKPGTTITVPEWHEGCLDASCPPLPPLEYPEPDEPEPDELGLPFTPVKIGKPNYSSAPDVVY